MAGQREDVRGRCCIKRSARPIWSPARQQLRSRRSDARFVRFSTVLRGLPPHFGARRGPFCGLGRRRAPHPLRSLPAAAHGSAPRELGEGFHHRPQRILHRNARLRVLRPHTGMYLLQYVTSAATLATYVLLPRTSVTQTTSRIFPWVNRRRQPRRRGVRAACAIPSLLARCAVRACPYCVSGKEGVMRRTPHHPVPLIRPRCGRGHGRPHPRGAGFHSCDVQ